MKERGRLLFVRIPSAVAKTALVYLAPSVIGVGMRSHAGIALKMFRTLAEKGINIQVISTSEIKVSIVIEDKYMELAVRALHKAFGLDQPGGSDTLTGLALET